MQTSSRNEAIGEIRSHRPDADGVVAAIAKRSFATLATGSPSGRPHVAGVLYAAAEDALFISTLRTSRKARNIATDPHVAVLVPVRRLPIGPPSSVHFQSTAQILDVDHPDVVRLASAGQLKSVTGHGELELAGGCFLRIPISTRLLTYGLGMSLRALIGDPLHASGVVERG